MQGDGTGNGTVTSLPSGINCDISGGVESGDCNENYDFDTEVTLTAEASEDSTFDGWSGGGCSGTGDCTVTMDQPHTVTATFTVYPNTVVESLFVGDGTGAIAVTPDGSNVYVTNLNGDTVFVIRTTDNTVVNTISVGSNPWGVDVTPDGGYVYVTNNRGGTVSVIRTTDNTVVNTISVGGAPHGVAVTPNGGNVYVANF